MRIQTCEAVVQTRVLVHLFDVATAGLDCYWYSLLVGYGGGCDVLGLLLYDRLMSRKAVVD